MKESTRILCKIGKEEVEVGKDQVFVVGRDKPAISLGE